MRARRTAASPFCSSHSTTDRRTKLVWESSAGKRAGAQVEPWASAPGNPSIGPYRSCGLAGTSKPCPAEPPSPGRAPLLPGILDQRTKSRQHALVAEQPRVAGRHSARVDRGVRVPEEHRVVARFSGQQRHVGEAGVQRGPVENGAVAVLVRARVQARPRWSARCCVGPVVGEEDAPAGQRVEGWASATTGWPRADRQSPRHWSSVMKRTLRAGGMRTTLADAGHAGPAVRPEGAATGSGRAQEVRIDAPPSFVPNSINQAPRRGATARCTARPPGTGSPVAERCIEETPLSVTFLRPARRGPAEAIRSCRCASACDCTALVWIIRSPHLLSPASKSQIRPNNALNSNRSLTLIQEYSNIAVCLC